MLPGKDGKEGVMATASLRRRGGWNSRHWQEKLAEARIALNQAEGALKLAEDDFTQADALGKELTRRLMELEEGDRKK